MCRLIGVLAQHFMRFLRAAEPKLCVKLLNVCKMGIKCQVDEAKCSRNVGFECHSESVGVKWVKLGHKWVNIGSNMGLNWVRWATRVELCG